MTLTVWIIALCTVVGLIGVWLLLVLALDRMGKRERERTEWHIAQRYRRRELSGGGQ